MNVRKSLESTKSLQLHSGKVKFVGNLSVSGFNTGRSYVSYWLWWHRWRRQTRTGCCAYLWHMSCGSRFPWLSICFSLRTVPGCRPRPPRTPGRLRTEQINTLNQRHLGNVPAYSGKHIVRGDFLIFSSNKSFLFKNRIMDVSVNHLLLQMESNSFKLSCIRFCNGNAD